MLFLLANVRFLTWNLARVLTPCHWVGLHQHNHLQKAIFSIYGNLCIATAVFLEMEGYSLIKLGITIPPTVTIRDYYEEKKKKSREQQVWTPNVFLAMKCSSQSSHRNWTESESSVCLLPSAAALNQKGILQLIDRRTIKKKKKWKLILLTLYFFPLLLKIWHKYVHYFFSVSPACPKIFVKDERPPPGHLFLFPIMQLYSFWISVCVKLSKTQGK